MPHRPITRVIIHDGPQFAELIGRSGR